VSHFTVVEWFFTVFYPHFTVFEPYFNDSIRLHKSGYTKLFQYK
jgi:hypothetical protein